MQLPALGSQIQGADLQNRKIKFILDKIPKMAKAHTLIVIPARWASQRFPGKVLTPIAGKPMVQWVWERAKESRLAEQVIIATDDQRVMESAQGFGADVIMTSSEHNSGTERCGEVANRLNFELIINLQGDEPLISPSAIDQLIYLLQNDDSIHIASLCTEIKSYQDYLSPAVVKVVCDDQDFALYFSRAPIPHYRGGEALLEQWKNQGKRPEKLSPPPYKHLGIYGYRADFLAGFALLPQTLLEQAEKLEQLRALSWGFKIKVLITEYDSIGVDLPEDLGKVQAILESEKK